MKFNSHTLALAAVLAAGLLVPAAGATTGPAYGRSSRPVCHTGYTRISVDGRHCAAAPTTAYSPGTHHVGITAAPETASASAKQHDDFSWGDAGVGAGAGAGLGIVMVGGGAFLLGRRRRHEPSPVG